MLQSVPFSIFTTEFHSLYTLATRVPQLCTISSLLLQEGHIFHLHPLSQKQCYYYAPYPPSLQECYRDVTTQQNIMEPAPPQPPPSGPPGATHTPGVTRCSVPLRPPLVSVADIEQRLVFTKFTQVRTLVYHEFWFHVFDSGVYFGSKYFFSLIPGICFMVLVVGICFWCLVSGSNIFPDA